MLDGAVPALKRCRYCGHRTGFLEDGAGPHGLGVRCDGCERHIGFLPKAFDVGGRVLGRRAEQPSLFDDEGRVGAGFVRTRRGEACTAGRRLPLFDEGDCVFGDDDSVIDDGDIPA